MLPPDTLMAFGARVVIVKPEMVVFVPAGDGKRLRSAADSDTRVRGEGHAGVPRVDRRSGIGAGLDERGSRRAAATTAAPAIVQNGCAGVPGPSGSAGRRRRITTICPSPLPPPAQRRWSMAQLRARQEEDRRRRRSRRAASSHASLHSTTRAPTKCPSVHGTSEEAIRRNAGGDYRFLDHNLAQWVGGSGEFAGSAVVVGARAGAGVRGGRVVDPRVAVDIGAQVSRDARVGE